MPRGVPNVKPRKMVDAAEQQVGQDTVVTMSSRGEAKLERESEIQVVDGPDWPDKAAALAFAEEMVTVMVHPTTEKDASQIVTISNGGRSQNFLRGKEITVKRKYVEVLARSKPTGYASQEFVNHDGDKAFRYPSNTGSQYPFTVVRDDNPKGAAWLKKILAEGA